MVLVEIKNIEEFRVGGPMKDGSLRIYFFIDPQDHKAVEELLGLRANGIPVDLTVAKAADFISQENGE